ncbi:nitrogen permease regulator of amino acid transport activity 3-domain-containing protein [Trametes polyzona]|nr:nitrogen permease regulator of amino acid transport activity 3-domain-containing protein [Trametes polyzona]
MSETLLCILLVTSSAKGSNLVYHWPPSPTTVPRLARPLPTNDFPGALADNPWRAANSPDNAVDDAPIDLSRLAIEDEAEYYWQRPLFRRDRSVSFTQPSSHPTSRRASPSKEPKDAHDIDGTRASNSGTPAHGASNGSGSGPRGGGGGGSGGADEYGTLLGYSGEFLAQILCPQSSLCHQKFELIVDDLAFVGHPVCADGDGAWAFAAPQPPPGPARERGRGSKKGQSAFDEDRLLTPERAELAGQAARGQASPQAQARTDDAGMQTFHFVVVLDLPDPSSSASGNISKYFDTVYEQLAFNVTAVLYQEQVLNRYVEAQSELLGTLREDFMNKGESFADFMYEALKVSTIAPVMKNLYESIKANTIARVTINEFPLEIQLPPYLNTLLHADEEFDPDEAPDDEDSEPDAWGPEMSFAWRLPALTPWKALLRLDGEGEQAYQLQIQLSTAQLNPEERELAEQLLRFLDLASVTLSLAEMASLLDWHLESQVYPAVRWLVQHRRAKIVDVVHPSLKTVFSVPQKFSSPLATLSADFARTFANKDVPPLPKLLAMISTATHKQTANHFFATVVGQKEHIQVYTEVVLWMLKRDLLIRLHLRIRIIATEQLKKRVREQWEERRARRRSRSRARSIAGGRERSRGASFDGDRRGGSSEKVGQSLETVTESSPVEYWVSLSPKTARKQTRQRSPGSRSRSKSKERSAEDKEEDEKPDELDEELLSSSADEAKWIEYFQNGGNDNIPSMISDPARATPLERRWLAAMCEGKDPDIAKRFERIHQYFDGKCSDDEILYRAEITRKQLREVLHHYEEYLQTFLHPS